MRESSKTARVTWERVVACLDHDGARGAFLRILAGRNIKGAGMASNRLAREAVADACTAAEDVLESKRGEAAKDRARLRVLRRRLEVELWP